MSGDVGEVVRHCMCVRVTSDVVNIQRARCRNYENEEACVGGSLKSLLLIVTHTQIIGPRTG
jgi:predicted secreted Zn-dependent protease